MATYVRGGVIVAQGIENIKTRFEPRRPAMGDLDGLMKNMVGRQYALFRCLLAIEGIIAMQFHHGASFCHCLRTIYLYFIIILCLAQKGYDTSKQYPVKRSFH